MNIQITDTCITLGEGVESFLLFEKPALPNYQNVTARPYISIYLGGRRNDLVPVTGLHGTFGGFLSRRSLLRLLCFAFPPALPPVALLQPAQKCGLLRSACGLQCIPCLSRLYDLFAGGERPDSTVTKLIRLHSPQGEFLSCFPLLSGCVSFPACSLRCHQ